MRPFHYAASSRSASLRRSWRGTACAVLPMLALSVACSEGVEPDGVPSFGNGNGQPSAGTSPDDGETQTNPVQGSDDGQGSAGTSSESPTDVGGNPASNGNDDTDNGNSGSGFGSAGTGSDGAGGSASMGGSASVGGSSMGGSAPIGMGGSAPMGMGGSAIMQGEGGGDMGQAGTDMQPPPPPPQQGCDGLYVCDDFEGVAAGGSPDTAIWSFVSNYNYSDTAAANIIQVSNAQANGGSQSARVEGSAQLSGLIASVPAQTFYARAFMRLDNATPSPVLMSIGTDHNADIRFRNFANYATINFSVGDDVEPQAARAGNCPDCPVIQANEWFCVEMFVDNDTQTTRLWIDGTEAASSVGNGGFPNLPADTNVRFGPMGLGGGSPGMFIDDVAIGPNPIGCQ